MTPVNPVLGYSQSTGTFSTIPFITLFETRDPTVFDVNYATQTRWVNTEEGKEWILLNVSITSSVPSANWLLLNSGSGTSNFRNYTNVTFFDSPYTVLSTDEYISVDCSAGTVTILFPDAPTFRQYWTVKDRTGNAGNFPISIQSVSGATLIDGMSTYLLLSNYAAINMIANNDPSYEIY